MFKCFAPWHHSGISWKITSSERSSLATFQIKLSPPCYHLCQIHGAHFGHTYNNIGPIQRRLVWPVHRMIPTSTLCSLCVAPVTCLKLYTRLLIFNYLSLHRGLSAPHRPRFCLMLCLLFPWHLEQYLTLLCQILLVIAVINVFLHLFWHAVCYRTITWDRSPQRRCRTCEAFSHCKYSWNSNMFSGSVWEGALKCPIDHFSKFLG